MSFIISLCGYVIGNSYFRMGVNLPLGEFWKAGEHQDPDEPQLELKLEVPEEDPLCAGRTVDGFTVPEDC
jgi:hypothetical protein